MAKTTWTDAMLAILKEGWNRGDRPEVIVERLFKSCAVEMTYKLVQSTASKHKFLRPPRPPKIRPVRVTNPRAKYKIWTDDIMDLIEKEWTAGAELDTLRDKVVAMSGRTNITVTALKTAIYKAGFLRATVTEKRLPEIDPRLLAAIREQRRRIEISQRVAADAERKRAEANRHKPFSMSVMRGPDPNADKKVAAIIEGRRGRDTLTSRVA